MNPRVLVRNLQKNDFYKRFYGYTIVQRSGANQYFIENDSLGLNIVAHISIGIFNDEAEYKYQDMSGVREKAEKYNWNYDSLKQQIHFHLTELLLYMRRNCIQAVQGEFDTTSEISLEISMGYQAKVYTLRFIERHFNEHKSYWTKKEQYVDEVGNWLITEICAGIDNCKECRFSSSLPIDYIRHS